MKGHPMAATLRSMRLFFIIRNTRAKSTTLFTSLSALALTLAVISGLTGCGALGANGSSQQAEHTLVFGAPVSLTGNLANEGGDTLRGYQLWVNAVNSAGGITVGNTTYHVALKYYDDTSSPAKSAQLTQRLISQDKVNFMLGPYGSAATLTDAPVAERNHIPMVEANGAAKAIFTPDNHYVFGVLSPTAEYARTMINAALALLIPPQTIAIIYASDAFSKEVAFSARDYASQQGLNVVFFQQYPTTASGVTQMLGELKTSANGSAPDFILGSGHGDEAIATMKGCKTLGINAKLFGFTVGPSLPEFISTLGAEANDVLGSSQWTPQENYHGIDSFGTPANYTQLYEAAYHQAPSYQAAESTAAGLAFQYAIQNASSVEPVRVRDALASLDIMTFYGRLKFDSTGANVFKPMATIQIQYGHLVTVYPSDVANAQMIYPTPPFGSR